MVRTAFTRDELLEMTAALGNGMIQSGRFFNSHMLVAEAVKLLSEIDEAMVKEHARADQAEKVEKDKRIADLRSGLLKPTDAVID